MENRSGTAFFWMQTGVSSVKEGSIKSVEVVLCSSSAGQPGSFVLALLASGLLVHSSVKAQGFVCNCASSGALGEFLSATSNGSSFTVGESVIFSGDLLSMLQIWTSGSSTVTAQLGLAHSLLESVSLHGVPYLNPSSTDLPAKKRFAGLNAIFGGDFKVGEKLEGLAVPLKKDCSVFCVGLLSAALDLLPELEEWWFEKAAFRLDRLSDDFGLRVSGAASTSSCNTFSSDDACRQTSAADASTQKWTHKIRKQSFG